MEYMKISQDRENCIGCGTCVAMCPKYWEMGSNGKAVLKGGKENSGSGRFVLEVEDAECNKDAAYSCPAQVIRIE